VPLWWRDLPYDLCFEDEEAGLAALRRLEALEGTPGAWAALTRARRGHKDAVERALEVFISDVFGMAGELNRNLQRRLLVLFSNSARASGLAQPDLRRNRRGAASGANRELFDSLHQWWRENREQIELRDPWLPDLAGQKID
jgi:hypothetical protein